MAPPNRRRPNTGVEDHLLHENIIVCCGEDAQELLYALGGIHDEWPSASHEYRCYRFWRFLNFTLVWTGIGTGCLEPLLCELLDAHWVKRLVLVGTAGAISTGTVTLGRAYCVNEAFLGGAAVEPSDPGRPLRPRLSAVAAANVVPEWKSMASTDYFYGFSRGTDEKVRRLQGADARLKAAVASLWDRVDMVDMETAQFYHLCGMLRPHDLEFIAIKGPSNTIGGEVSYNSDVLRETLTHAFRILGVTRTFSRPSPSRTSNTEKPAESSSKLMEEVKLYWTVQTGIAAVLGFLGTHLSFSSMAAAGLVKNAAICGVATLLVTIGAIYNLIGNYYTRIAGAQAGNQFQQENIVTPRLAQAYLAVSGLLGAVGLVSLVRGSVLRLAWDWGVWFYVGCAGAGLLVGAVSNWLICRSVVQGLCRMGPEEYRGRYSAPLQWLYCVRDAACRVKHSE